MSSGAAPAGPAADRVAFIIERFRLEREALCLVVQSCVPNFKCEEFGGLDEVLSRDSCEGLELVVAGGFDRESDGLEALRSLSEHVRPAKAVAIVDKAEFSWIRRAMSCGIMGFVPRSASRKTFCRAIRLVLAGEIYFPSDQIDRLTRPPAQRSLSSRQREVLSLLLEGLTTKEIAARLGLHLSTVRNHMQAIFKGLNVHNRTQAVLLVIGRQSSPEGA
jgi:DNA-binding NarL/FixJ family response regulator